MNAPNGNIMDEDTKQLLRRVSESPGGLGDESAWIEVIQRMDAIYADIVRYQVELEEKNAVLEDAQRFIQSVISSMTDVLIVADIQGRIQQTNRALETLTGKSCETLEGQALASLFTPDYAPQVEDFAEHIRTDSVSDCEVKMLDAAGEATPIAINCTPRFDHEGRLRGLVITGRPLGELQRAYDRLQTTHDQLKATQQQLVQSEKMASLGQLVAGVAHELNNPISFMFGNMHALKRYEKRLGNYLAAVHGPLEGEAREQLRHELKIDRLMQDIGPLIDGSLEGAERVSEIVEALRRFSTAGQQKCRAFDLARVINTAAEWVIKARRVQPGLTLEIPDHIRLSGYEGYVHQILVNLIQNAADATHDSAQACIGIRAGVDDAHAWVEVRDNGPGIPAHQLLRIFDPFFTTKPVGEGTGLGLYISYNLATEQCRGRLEAADLDGAGACFTLTLPLEIGE